MNLTPHALTLRSVDGIDHVLPPSGTVARVKSTPGAATEVEGCPVPIWGRDVYGAIEGLPPAESGTMYVVSAIVGSALAGAREDVLVPGTGPQDGAVRDDQNRIVAVTRLKRA